MCRFCNFKNSDAVLHVEENNDTFTSSKRGEISHAINDDSRYPKFSKERYFFLQEDGNEYTQKIYYLYFVKLNKNGIYSRSKTVISYCPFCGRNLKEIDILNVRVVYDLNKQDDFQGEDSCEHGIWRK